MMIRIKSILTFSIFMVGFTLQSQNSIPHDRVLATSQLVNYLNKDAILSINSKVPSEAELAAYFRQKFSERYFYDYKNANARFENFSSLYHSQSNHKERAEDHMQKFADSTHWQMPFNYLNGEPVNAYGLRHLARQHKMLDVAFEYFYNNKDPKYINYFTNQLSSLNDALVANKFETIDSGNGVYEVFRSGYRVVNWLTIHNLFLGEKEYSDHEQLITIATLLQHASNLYENNAEFQPGNHQTRGMSALAMLSILFKDFQGADLWYERSMTRLEEHLSKEVNADGFQFERSVHYHMSDIETYFFVYQLAQKSNVKVSAAWEAKLKSLFTTLVKISYPDKSAPVLQDDTNDPWAEKNDISGAITLGYVLFQDPQLGYFTVNHVDEFMYWFVDQKQLTQLNFVVKEKPSFGSFALPDTKYYISREGWNSSDKMMIITAGLDPDKPDHQHGDMLGVQAMANGNVILPNYQVRYSLSDYEFFKNSMVKNVALVDNELQGKGYKGNSGGSGFGKFKSLPNPKTIAWNSNENFDLFAGSHDGFENIGVKYSRQVLFVKNGFWIVKDNFKSDKIHEFKQVWQGHYTTEDGADLLRANFADATGLDILQLNKTDKVITSGKRGKEWAVVSKSEASNFSFITVLHPYVGFDNSIDASQEVKAIDGWKTNDLNFQAIGDNIRSISKSNECYLFGVKEIKTNKTTLNFSVETDIYIRVDSDKILIQAIGVAPAILKINGHKTAALNGNKVKAAFSITPGDVVTILKK